MKFKLSDFNKFEELQFPPNGELAVECANEAFEAHAAPIMQEYAEGIITAQVALERLLTRE